MSPEEKTPKEKTPSHEDQLSAEPQSIPLATLVGDSADSTTPLDGSVVKSVPNQQHLTPWLKNNPNKIAARGGAVGAFLLGCLAVAGSLITGWSAINSVLGILLGLWGLNSERRLLASFGMILCAIGLLLSIYFHA